MLTPQTETELAAAIKETSEPLEIVGGGTRSFAGCTATEELKTSGLSGIELYEPGALTLVVKAGTPMFEVEAALRKENQRLAFEPMDHRALLGTDGEPTIGGVVAANVSGPRRVQAGACRDSLIGVRFVDGSGNVLKNGGRVMKNVTGYDLVKLMCGSYGTLGVLSEVSFKVLPGIASTATLKVDAEEIGDAVKIMSRAMSSPFEVSGAAFDPRQNVVMLRLEGFEDSVTYRLSQLTSLLAGFGSVSAVTGIEESKSLWTDIRDVTALAGTDGDLWRISVKPTDAPKCAAALNGADMFFDWGGGLIWTRVSEGFDVRGEMAGISGHATCLVGNSETFHPEPVPVAQISAGLREKFDPKGKLNPGVMS